MAATRSHLTLRAIEFEATQAAQVPAKHALPASAAAGPNQVADLADQTRVRSTPSPDAGSKGARMSFLHLHHPVEGAPFATHESAWLIIRPLMGLFSLAQSR